MTRRKTTFRLRSLRPNSHAATRDRDPDVTTVRFVTACGGQVEALQSDLGLQAFTEHIRKRTSRYADDISPLIDIIWGPDDSRSYHTKVLEISADIANFVHQIDAQTTIEDLVQQLLDRHNVRDAAAYPHRAAAGQLVFAVIGWCTLLYTVIPVPSGTHYAITHETKATSNSPTVKANSRPIGAILRGLSVVPISCPPCAPAPSHLPALLVVTNLNYFALKRLGDVSIVWTSDIALHLHFDRFAREKPLQLFRFPTLLSQIYQDPSRESLISLLANAHICRNHCDQKLHSITKAYMLEVLLSYRVIFGQDSRARKLFREEERASLSTRGTVDPLLTSLCCKVELGQETGLRDYLRERGVYNAPVDFPHLGARLVELQDYSTNQKPRRLIDVWNDHRDPRHSFEFWAVVIVGGLSITLSLMQVLIGACQLVFAVRQAPS